MNLKNHEENWVTNNTYFDNTTDILRILIVSEVLDSWKKFVPFSFSQLCFASLLAHAISVQVTVR